MPVDILEGFDIAAMSLAVPRLEGALGLVPASFGWVFTALLIGLGLGGATIAPLGDRFGRRTLIVAGCLATGLATFGTATATTTTEFLVWRLATGIALGACLPNVSALSAELAPERLRATIMAVVSAGIPIGLAIAGFLAPPIIAAAGWQGLFLVPGGAALALAIALFAVLKGGAPVHAGQDTEKAAASKLPQLLLFSAPWLFPFAVFAAMLAVWQGVPYLFADFVTAWRPRDRGATEANLPSPEAASDGSAPLDLKKTRAYRSYLIYLAGPPLVLHVIDLQRVRRGRGGRLGRRWIVKDLASLDYSAPAGIVTRTDKVRFLRRYLGVGRLDAAARGLIADVAAKTARIARQDAKLQARKSS